MTSAVMLALPLPTPTTTPPAARAAATATAAMAARNLVMPLPLPIHKQTQLVPARTGTNSMSPRPRSGAALWCHLRRMVLQLIGQPACSPHHHRRRRHPDTAKATTMTMTTTTSSSTRSCRTNSSSPLLLHPDFWMEALDEHHRYGFYLRAFHAAWMHDASVSAASLDRSFFHWLDHGAGSALELPGCNRRALTDTRVEYCPTDATRQPYEAVFIASEDGTTPPRLRFTASGKWVHTDRATKWIFVLDYRSPRLFVGRKQKGRFHHSSFLAGAPIAAAGKLVVRDGALIAVEPHSGHFKPSLAHVTALCSFLTQCGVDVGRVRFVKPKKWRDEWPFASVVATAVGPRASDSIADWENGSVHAGYEEGQDEEDREITAALASDSEES